MDDVVKLIIDQKTLSLLSDLKGANADELRNTLAKASTNLRDKQNHAKITREAIKTQIVGTEENLRTCEANMLQFNDHLASKLEEAQVTADEDSRAFMYLEATQSICATKEYSKVMRQTAESLNMLQLKLNKKETELRRLNQELVEVLYVTIKHVLGMF